MGQYGEKFTGINVWSRNQILKRKCECDGCKNNLENSQLTISSFHGAGKIINPISMKIMCYEHAYENDRFVLRTNFEL